MLDYVDSACKAWGRCSRWIITSSNKLGDPEGYPSANTLAKARDGMLTLGQGGPRSQNFNEVRVGDALMIARAIAIEPHMPLVLTAHLWAQYVVEGRARHKLAGLSGYLRQVIGIAEYWRNIDRAHYFLAARIEAPISDMRHLPRFGFDRLSAAARRPPA